MKNLPTYCLILLLLFWEMELSAQENQTAILHTVEKGNTIYSLSREYKVSVLDIKTWNNMKNNNLSVGDQLIVGYESVQPEAEAEEKKESEEEKPVEVEEEAQEKKPEPKEVKEESTAEEKTMTPKSDDKDAPPASLEDLGTNIDDENIYNISLETVEEPKTRDSRDLGNSMALPKPTSLVFCGGVDRGAPIGISTVFYKQESSSYFYVFLENTEQFDDSGLIVELYQKEPFSKRFNNHLGTKKYSIKERWKFTNFKFDVPDPGEYRMLVYNSEKKKLAEGFFVILEK